MPFQLAVVVDPVPRDVDRHRGTHAGEAVHLRRVGHLLERVAGHSFLREDREAGAGVTVAPGGRLHPLGTQPLPYTSNVHPGVCQASGQGVVGSFVCALQCSILLRGCPGRGLHRGASRTSRGARTILRRRRRARRSWPRTSRGPRPFSPPPTPPALAPTPEPPPFPWPSPRLARLPRVARTRRP